jgi:cobalt transport protein ATP-binding subunit
MTRLQIANVGFRYDDGTIALDSVSFTVERGEKIAVVGPNGAGKSTLLHLIAGFRMPFTGTLEIDGITLDRKNADALRRRVGILFQDPDDQLFMPTVAQDVAFGPRNLKMDDIEGRVSRSMRSVGVESLSERRPHKLSHGMKKRAALAGILAMDPEILLLDEPTAGLDPRARTELIALLRSMDRTMIIATHDIEAAAEIADRAVVLNVGVVMSGTIRDLILAKDVLTGNGLELPPVSKLFSILKAMGYAVEDLPVSMDEAAAELTKVINRQGKHMHAHIHEHDHSRRDGKHTHEHARLDEDKSHR